jgi:hypothetical protein
VAAAAAGARRRLATLRGVVAVQGWLLEEEGHAQGLLDR